jgi:hypothetical protein
LPTGGEFGWGELSIEEAGGDATIKFCSIGIGRAVAKYLVHVHATECFWCLRTQQTSNHNLNRPKFWLDWGRITDDGQE